jgi:hypothetical protein
MKILDIVERDGKIVVSTNNAARPEFVYPVGRFDDLVSLQKEIDKSRMFEAERESKRLFKVKKLKDAFGIRRAKEELMAKELAVLDGGVFLDA